jgi:hypothetical protein
MIGSYYPSPVADISLSSALVLKCPYRSTHSVYCSASIMRAAVSKRQSEAYCSTENFDCCPVFLGKVLRGT